MNAKASMSGGIVISLRRIVIIMLGSMPLAVLHAQQSKAPPLTAAQKGADSGTNSTDRSGQHPGAARSDGRGDHRGRGGAGDRTRDLRRLASENGPSRPGAARSRTELNLMAGRWSISSGSPWRRICLGPTRSWSRPTATFNFFPFAALATVRGAQTKAPRARAARPKVRAAQPQRSTPDLWAAFVLSGGFR